jgi:site-specific DNA recombinase
MKRVIGYVRVSSEIQVEKDNSVRNQVLSIKNYCESVGYELITIYKDEGISGLKNNRDGLNTMMDEIRKSKIDMVVVYSLSRLGRKLVDVIGWIDELEKFGVQFLSIKENFGSDGIVGKLMRNILGSINEFEVGLLGERIRDVKKFKKSKMEVYTGKICFGWDRDDKKLIVNKLEMNVLEDINDLRENGWRYNRISQKLNSSGILSKEGGRWFAGSVRSVYLNGVINSTTK